MTEVRFDRERLLELMEREKMGDTELGRKAGVSRTMIYYLKTGKRKTASAEVVSRIAGALNASTAYLLGEEEGQNTLAQVLPSAVHQLTEIAVGLSGLRQEELLRIAATLQALEAEEGRRTIAPAVHEVIRLVERIQPAGGEELIEALQTLIENGARRWLIDLGGGAEEDDTEEPGEGE